MQGNHHAMLTVNTQWDFKSRFQKNKFGSKMQSANSRQNAMISDI